jgi:hypothetical protein
MQHLNAQEWLEAVRLTSGPEADFAAEIADTWLTADQIDECAEISEARDAADKAESELSAIEDALTESPLAAEFITTGHDGTDDDIRKFHEFAQEMSDQLDAIRVVLIDGGVLDPRDLSSNLAAILTMFVPPADD